MPESYLCRGASVTVGRVGVSMDPDVCSVWNIAGVTPLESWNDFEPNVAGSTGGENVDIGSEKM